MITFLNVPMYSYVLYFNEKSIGCRKLDIDIYNNKIKMAIEYHV